MRMGHANRHAHRDGYRHAHGSDAALTVAWINRVECANQVCMDMCVNMCIDLCIDMCIDMCMDMCIDMCVDMCTDMCTHM